MGLDIHAVRFLLAARRGGAVFDQVLMLGRQDLNVPRRTVCALLAASGLSVRDFQASADTAHADPLFRALGARTVHAMDASDYEGADLLHDLNRPIREEWRQRYDVVYDGGTLEHVFNFPVALQNAMEMVRPNGFLILHQCANNWCGHGFYQFSPELFFRALCEENGFRISQMVLHSVNPMGRWFEVADPAVIRRRVELISHMPMHLLVLARRTRVCPVFASPPQQSDYTTVWRQGDRRDAQTVWPPSRRDGIPVLSRLVRLLCSGFRIFANNSILNRNCFHPLPRRLDGHGEDQP